MDIYQHLTIAEFHALSKTERRDLAKLEIPLVITLENANSELISEVGRNAFVWLNGNDRLALDCRRIVEGQKWSVPILTSDFLPKMLLLAPWRFPKKQFLHLFTYLGGDQFYHWDAVNLNYDDAYRLIFSHSTYYHHGMVSVTDFCNLKCKMCSYHGEDPRYEFSNTRKQRPKGELADEDYYTYVDQLAKGKDLLYCGTGELFVSKKWHPYLKYAHEKGCHLRVLTNGMLLTTDVAKKLIDLDVGAVAFSIDGHRADLVENIRLGSNFNVILNNLRNLIKLRDESGSKMVINVHCSVLEELQPFQNDIHLFWKNFGVDGLSFFPEWVDWDTTTTINFLDKKTPSAQYPCWNAMLTPILLTNGLISPCTAHLQGEWSTAWKTDWLQPLRPNGLDAAVRAYRHFRLNSKSDYRKNCSKCTGKMTCYVTPEGDLTHCQSYSFSNRHTPGEAGFVKHD